MDEQLQFALDVTSRLASAGISYMMTGSMAMGLYSAPRMTRDIDIIVEIGMRDADALVRLFSEDCYIDAQAVRQAMNEEGMFNIIHKELLIKVDFIIRKNQAYRENEFSRKRKMSIEGSEIFIAAPEDLILSKLLWAKNSHSLLQIRDVGQLLASVADIDRVYLQKWAKSLGVEGLLKEAEEK